LVVKRTQFFVLLLIPKGSLLFPTLLMVLCLHLNQVEEPEAEVSRHIQLAILCLICQCSHWICRQFNRFDTVGCVAGRASGLLKKLNGGMLA